MLRKICLAITLLVAVAAYKDAQAAVNQTVSGIICNPVLGADVTYSALGAANASTIITATVECAIPLGLQSAGTPLTHIVVVVYDRSASKDVSCTVMELNADGGSHWSATRSTTGSGANPVSLGFGLPATASATTAWRVSCTLPPVSSGNASSVAIFHTNNN
jgi:hypothetical protein